MLFNSIQFFVFLVVVLVLVHRLTHRWQNRVLLVASYVFYGWWDWRFLSLIALSTILDFNIAKALDNTENEDIRRRLTALSIGFNLGLLGIFKYFNFFVDSLIEVFDTFGLGVSQPTLNIVLPVGISFYTFQTIGYTIDVYRKKIGHCPNFIDFALYVAFFPQLVAGPIERASHLLPQVTKPRRVGVDDVATGAHLILFGLFKKVVIADNLAPIVDAVYGSADPTGTEIVVATWCFAFQIYCDFSGYSLIARGVARWLGFDLMKNFWLPYASANPQEFWTRWHISLSSWLRDYLYIPLGGNRGTPGRVSRNLMLTMLLGGLWHGAAWNFVLWGAFQGAILVLHRKYAGHHRHKPREKPSWLAIATMFQVACYGWLLFRAESLGQVVDFSTAILTNHGLTDRAVGGLALLIALAGPLMLLEWWQYRGRDPVPPETDAVPRWPTKTPASGVLYAACALGLVILAPIGVQEFIYFQF